MSTRPPAESASDETPLVELGFDMAVLGGGLPPQVESLIREAGLARQQRDIAEPLLLRARAMAPTHPATLIALYRFHFYGHRLREAREIARETLGIARSALVPGHPDPVSAELPPFTDDQARFDAAVRFYLFTLKGFAYLNLRLGDHLVGRAALDELKRLDPNDRVGGAVLSVVLERASQTDDEAQDYDSIARLQGRQPHRGWGAL